MCRDRAGWKWKVSVRALQGRGMPLPTLHRREVRANVKKAMAPKFVIARRPQADVAISGRHFQFVQGADKNAPTDCVCSGGGCAREKCSGAHCAAVGGFPPYGCGVPLAGSERHGPL